MNEVDAIVARLLSLHPKLIDFSLDRIRRLLEKLGHPERRLPPVIHVAGTNGKGSTIAFMRAVLEAAGASVHVYTSPNLVRFNERFRLGRPGGGALVSDAVLVDTLDECERVNAGTPITVFEITTAAGLLMFSRHPADVLLLEVGLGGRLDATNVIEQPLGTVITSVSHDHAEYLGDSIAKIAAEKAGILKPDVPAIIAPQGEEAREVIARQAARIGTTALIAGEDWAVTQERGRLVYQDEDGLLDLSAPRLRGRHQFDNAGTAIATLRSVGTQKVTAAAFETGLLAADWPARMQRLSHGRLLALAPRGVPGLTPGASAVAFTQLRLALRIPRGRASMVTPLLMPLFLGVVLSRRGHLTIPGLDNEPGLALAAIGTFELEHPPRILATGSLYFAGEVLAANGTPPT